MADYSNDDEKDKKKKNNKKKESKKNGPNKNGEKNVRKGSLEDNKRVRKAEKAPVPSDKAKKDAKKLRTKSTDGYHALQLR